VNEQVKQISSDYSFENARGAVKTQSCARTTNQQLCALCLESWGHSGARLPLEVNWFGMHFRRDLTQATFA
jgi:hypothetical protein